MANNYPQNITTQPTLNKSSQYIKDINSLIQKNSNSQSQSQQQSKLY